ncbi:YdeI/OmpD-associated family protein [Cryobacterium sp. PAMC25264]|uniref:YdeI/OmpD-associated family protein n=1 Tax=Cryobacterium sp. PAMC25264 TaxID=2861288 RepID=UPI001C6387FF|nr:YdeI/OmpD-associated family protein [Cryobacterium sp. PAMC25264]QYF73462.1 YdeI/OmpD-associated family protein [Cryobacterium sp. PAMC25264]
MEFRTVIEQSGATATGIPVPDDVVASLGPGKRHAITVTVNGHSYRSSVAPYRGKYMIALSADNRDKAGVVGGDEVEVTIELDDQPRTVEEPAALTAALAADPAARTAFDGLSYSNQRRHVLAIDGAKTEATRQRSLDAVLSELRGA